ncbi:MAG: TonB-dependent receptor [Salinivirgaceae bacterium]
MVLRFLWLGFLLLLQFCALGQITGTVYDAEARAPLWNAAITGGKVQALSNENGIFIIDAESDTLFISHLGFTPDTLSGSDLTGNLTVYLFPVFTQLEQIVVNSGLSRHKLMQMPSSVSLLTKNELAASSGISYVEKLNQLPGIFVHQGTLNTSRITIRGIGSRSPYATNRIKAYFNEIPLTNGDGTTEIEDINASLINTLEVLKGSKSALYGSGLGGAILISGKNNIKEGWHGSTALEASSFKTLKPELTLTYKKNQWMVASAYALTQTDGWRQNSKYLRHNLNLWASYQGNKSSTEVLIQLIKTNAQIPSSLNRTTFNQSPDSTAANWFVVQGFEEYQKGLVGIKHEQRWRTNFTNTTVLFSNFKNSYESRPFNILSDQSKGIGFRNISKVVLGNFDWQAGVEFLYDTYNWRIYETLSGNQGPLVSEFMEHRIPLNLFMQSGYRFNNGVLLEAGISYNFLSYSLTDLSNSPEDLSGQYSYKPILSPYLGINVPIKKHWVLYGSVSNGFSAPSVEETLMPTGEINPNLKPETGWNLESGAQLQTEKGHFFMDATVYLLLVDNLLVTERLSETVFYGRNAGSTQHSGIEVSTNLRLNNEQRFHLPHLIAQVAYNYSHPVFTQFVTDEISYSGNFLPGIPQHHLWTSILMQYRAGWFLVTQLEYTGSQYLNDANSEQYPSYFLSHMKMGYRTKTTKLVDYGISAGIKNVFNQQYASMLLVNAPSPGGSAPRYYYPGEPRSFYVSSFVGF